MAQIREEVRTGQAASIELQRIIADSLQAIGRSWLFVEPPSGGGQAAQQIFPPAQDAATGLGAESLRALEEQGLFILGAARSGTTILTRSLNRAPEILVLEEPESFLCQGIGDFSTYFNNKHTAMRNRCMKGTYLAPPHSPDSGPLATFSRLGRDYRYVGEKSAIGPHDYPVAWQRQYLDFHARYFFRSHYIYIMRTPVESIWSMHKMFPERPMPMLFEAWLRTLALSLDAYHVFPNSRAVFFDNLGSSTIERLGTWLEMSIPFLPGTFGQRYVQSAVSADQIPEALRPYAKLCQECTDLYRDLRDCFSRDELVYCGSATEWQYFTMKLHYIEDLLTRLHPDAATDDRRLRLVA
ncbi:MAG TPA: sulfotransferase [Pirellulales bacterium]|nr:sulfotransferase [Pirellulales bacterium]